jgi:hypothetical protein
MHFRLGALGLLVILSASPLRAQNDAQMQADQAQAKTYLKEYLQTLNRQYPFADWQKQVARSRKSLDKIKDRVIGKPGFDRELYPALADLDKDLTELAKRKGDLSKLIGELYVSSLVVRVENMFYKDGRTFNRDAKLAFQRSLMPYEAGSLKPKTAFLTDLIALDREFRNIQTDWLFAFSQDFLGRRVEEHLRAYKFAQNEAYYDDYSLQLDYWTRSLSGNPAQSLDQIQQLSDKFEAAKGGLRQNLMGLLDVLNTDMLFSDLLEYARKQNVDFTLEVEEKIEASLKERNQATLAPINQRIAAWKSFAMGLREKLALARNEVDGQKQKSYAKAEAERRRLEDDRKRAQARADEDRRFAEEELRRAQARAEEDKRLQDEARRKAEARAADERRQAEMRAEQERQRAEARAEEERKQALSREEAERRAKERAIAQEAERKRLEQERLAREEAARREQERLERERQARLETERKEAERREQERQARLEAERKEQARIEAERQARLDAERKEQERLERERLAALEAEQRRQEAEQKAKFKQTLNELKTFTFKSETSVDLDDDSKQALKTKSGFLKTSYVASGVNHKVDRAKFSDTLAFVQKFHVEEGSVDFSKMSLQERSNNSAYTYPSPSGRTNQGDLENFVAEVALGSFSTYFSFLSYVTPSHWYAGRSMNWQPERDADRQVADREFSYVDLVVDAHRKRSGGATKTEGRANLPANMIVILDDKGAIIRFQSFGDISQVSIHSGDLTGGKLYYKFLNYSADRQNIYLNGIDSEIKVGVPGDKS